MQSIEDKKLKKDHNHVVSKVRDLIVDCEKKDIRLDLVLHTALTVLFDTALDTALWLQLMKLTWNILKMKMY